jgi:uncharacterized membrane protein YkoI
MDAQRALQMMLPVVLLVLLGRAAAAPEMDQDAAREAVQAGRIRPLAELMALVERRYAGQIVNTRLQQQKGRWLYQFTLMPRSGHLYKLKVDAVDGSVVGYHGLVQEHP